MSGPEEIRADMDLHAKVNEHLAAQNRRITRIEAHSDLLQASIIRMEQDARRQADEVRGRLESLEQRQSEYQEDSQNMIEGLLRVSAQNTEAISDLAEFQQYAAEITARAKSDRWWAEGWRRLSEAKGKILGLGGIAAGIGSLWHYWDSLIAWLKNGGSG